MISRLYKKSRNNSDANTLGTFLIGSAIGAAGAYFFLTEKGMSARKMIVEKTKKLSIGVKGQPGYQEQDKPDAGPDSSNDQAAISSLSPANSPSVGKAHNMIHHLKDNHNTDPSLT